MQGMIMFNRDLIVLYVSLIYYNKMPGNNAMTVLKYILLINCTETLFPNLNGEKTNDVNYVHINLKVIRS